MTLAQRRAACAATTRHTCATRGARDDTALSPLVVRAMTLRSAARCVNGDDAARDDTARYAFAAGCSCALRSARDDYAQLRTARLA